MPKPKESQDEQSARFCAEVERLIAAGELNPIEADAAFSQLSNNLRGSSSTLLAKKSQKDNLL